MVTLDLLTPDLLIHALLTPDLLTRVLLTPDLLTGVLLTPDLVAVAVCAVDRGGVYDGGGGERARGRRDLPRPRQHGRR